MNMKAFPRKRIRLNAISGTIQNSLCDTAMTNGISQVGHSPTSGFTGRN